MGISFGASWIVLEGITDPQTLEAMAYREGMALAADMLVQNFRMQYAASERRAWPHGTIRITAASTIAASDVQVWLDERKLVLASVQQHLLRMQQRMKVQADKHRRERVFTVGDRVFLRLQPYI
jgi:hypothetical protein